MKQFQSSIILGCSLDGAPAPVGLPGLTATVGPLGYLELLGQWLGLTGTVSAEAVRIGTCLRALRAKPDGFWGKSLDADPWAVARRVLSMYDALRLAGWDGQADRVPSRVADLAALDIPPNGVADRLQAIIAYLTTRPQPLPDLTLLEPAELWPGLWNSLFVVLRENGVRVDEMALPGPKGDRDLAAWQQFLHDGSNKAAFVGDGSLTLVTGRNEAAIADVVSSFLMADGTDAAMIGAGRGMLTALLRARRQPRLAAAHGGDLGAQILALGLALIWEPFDAAAAIDFLALPEHPLGVAAPVLTKAILEMPGHGGPVWRSARYKSLRERLRRDRTAGRSRDERHRRARKLLADLDAWFPSQRFVPADGMPASAALTLCARIGAWAQASTRPEYGVAASMLAEAIEASEESFLTPRMLGRILETIASRTIEVLPEQAAPWRYFANPAQRIDPVDTTVWWLENSPAGSTRLWRQDERDWIYRAGYRLDEQVRRARERHGIVRAILGCTRRLIFVRPPADGEGDVPPAAMGMLGGCFGSSLDPAWMPADALQSPGILAGTILVGESMPLCAPPLPRRDWEVPPGLIVPRREESASGMEKLLGCPLAWTLTYGAKLQSRGIAALPDTNRLIGLFAHDIMRRVLEEHIAAPNLAGNRAEQLFRELLPECAAPLLQPGFETTRERVRIQLGRAVNVLVEAINTSKLELVGAEREVHRLARTDDGVSLAFTGRIDLLLRTASGSYAVLDAKWSRSGKWYRRRLEDGRAVQLAVYAWLVGISRPATAGYFLLADARLYAADGSVFRNSAVSGPSLADTWASALADYHAALGTLAQGRVVATGIGEPDASDAQSQALTIDPPCGFCDFQTICGKGNGHE